MVSSLLNELHVRCVHPGCYWTGRWDERALHSSHCLARELLLMQAAGDSQWTLLDSLCETRRAVPHAQATVMLTHEHKTPYLKRFGCSEDLREFLRHSFCQSCQEWKTEMEHVRSMLVEKEKETRTMHQRINQLKDHTNQLEEEAVTLC